MSSEAVGFAASITGLLGITGQLLNGILFIKGFLNDAIDAPEDIRSLVGEEDGTNLDLEEERKALKKYTDMVERLGTKIEKHAKTFGVGNGRWWERMKMAGKKNGLAGYLVCVERAKTWVMDIEMKIMINLQHHHRNILTNTNRILETIQSNSNGDATAIKGIHVKSTAIENWTGTAHIAFGNLSRGIEDIKSSLDRLKKHRDELITERSPKLPETVVQPAAVTDTRCGHENGPSIYTISQKVKHIHRSRFRTPIFDIEFITKNIQRRLTSQAQNLSTGPLENEEPTSERLTTYRIRIRPLCWASELSFEPESLHTRYGASFQKCAYRNLDLPEVRRLFEAGQASPQDCVYPFNESLVAIVFARLFASQPPLSSTEAVKGVELLKFLIRCLGGDIGFPGGHLFSAFNFKKIIGRTQRSSELGEQWTEAKEIAKRLSISFSQTPIYSVLMTQRKWWIDTQVEGSCIDWDERHHFSETNLQMLNDTSGLLMQKAIARGDHYIPYTSGLRLGAAHSPIHSLLKIAAITIQEDLHKCILTRLSVLLQNEPHCAYDVYDVSQSFYPEGAPAMPLSCTEASLWTPAQIQDFFDADLYSGIPELLSWGLVYQTRDDQRVTFMRRLLRGDFTGLEDGAILTLSIMMENELAVWWAGVNEMIRDVDSCFKTRIILGGWPADHSKCLMPGIDFKLPPGGKFDDHGFDDVKDWKCIQESWEKELDCYPYDCSLPRKKFADDQAYMLEMLRYAENRQSRTILPESRIKLLKSKIAINKTREAC
ncbi:hypothetical protein V8E51_010933 [Hyaloscypha variabilis]